MTQKAIDVFKQYLASSQKEMAKKSNIIHAIPDNKKLAIFGTGHHASMLLANTDLARKNIVAIYDSDKKKEGYCMNGIKICPFNPNDCISGKVECILLATYTAQKALEEFLSSYEDIVEIIQLYN